MSNPSPAETDGPPETPMQRALRLRKAALAAKRHPAAAQKSPRDNAAAPTGASKPWMKK